MQLTFFLPALFTISLLCLENYYTMAAPGVSDSPSNIYQSLKDFIDFDNLPETKFSCSGKVIGGYYADVETGCQMFHVCTIGQKGEVMDIKFLCLNGTVFDQETRVCERVDEVDCSKTEEFYNLNLALYGASGFSIKSEQGDTSAMTPPPTSTTTTPRPNNLSPASTLPNQIQNPSSSDSGIALNSYDEVPSMHAPVSPNPSYTLAQQHHPHGIAHHYFSNSARPYPFLSSFNYFNKELSHSSESKVPTIIATSRSVTKSVSIPLGDPSTAPPVESSDKKEAQTEEDYADYLLDSFFKDVPRIQVERSKSISVSASSKSLAAAIVSSKREKRDTKRKRHTVTITNYKSGVNTVPTAPHEFPGHSFTCFNKFPGGDVKSNYIIFQIYPISRRNRIQDNVMCEDGTFKQVCRTCIASDLVECSDNHFYFYGEFLPLPEALFTSNH